ncbi:MAG: type III polyketide synthase [Anaerolineae bacterium]|nr:type III polyketide synthase [Anaerolineae bacterium]
MPDPAIRGLATAVPPYRHAQKDIYEQFIEPRLGPNRLARAAFMSAQIDYRHSVFGDGSFYDRRRTFAERNEAYMRHARPLAAEAISRCLEDASLAPGDIDDLIVVSCTGFDTPGLDLLLAADLGMRHDLRRTFIGAMGCYAAFPGLYRAASAVRASPETRALVLCIELGTLHFQDDPGTDNLLAMALFGDGAAAVLLDGEAAPGPYLIDQRTFSDYQTLHHMAWHVGDGGFRLTLSSYVPNVLRAQAAMLVDALLAPHGLRRSDVRFWGIHPGGTLILDYLERALDLEAEALRFSRRVLREYGNLSSATVLFVLDEMRRSGEPRPGDLAVLMAFGPGLTFESCLLRW